MKLLFIALVASFFASCSLSHKSQQSRVITSDSTAHKEQSATSTREKDTANTSTAITSNQSDATIELDPDKAVPDTAGQVTIEITPSELVNPDDSGHISGTDIGFIRQAIKIKVPANTKTVHLNWTKTDKKIDSSGIKSKDSEIKTKASGVHIAKAETDTASSKTTWRPGILIYAIGALCLIFLIGWIRREITRKKSPPTV